MKPSCESVCELSGMDPLAKADPQLRFPPHNVHMAFANPVHILAPVLHIVLPQHLRQHEIHLHLRKAANTLVTVPHQVGSRELATHFRPKHPRGPSEKG